jgi:microcompartment protein CcmL/EutN
MELNAIGVLEFVSIARGMVAADEMCKVADVKLFESTTICPGKYLVVIGGPVADVESSVATGLKIGSHTVVEKLVIPNVYPDMFSALAGASVVENVGALGVLEAYSAASTIEAADACVKAAEVTLIELRLANGLGGKGFFTMTGEISAVRSALDAGRKAIKKSGFMIESFVIPSPHKQLKKKVL